jgi:glycine/D-amino acid oxidase-like deaminating enzyme
VARASSSALPACRQFRAARRKAAYAPDRQGRIIAGQDFAGGDPGGNPDATARDLFATAKAALRGGLELDFHTVGYRPTPTDGLPIIGRAEGVDGLYIALMHSGITLASAVGLFATREISMASATRCLRLMGSAASLNNRADA